jgi:hypothetical protein
MMNPLAQHEAQSLINTARWTLACRGRETDPVTHANPREVYLYELDRGINIALFGMTPDRRLPIESFFGYVLAKNGIPTAYGGGWIFLNRCEIGINIFPEMRGGESTLIFAQILRLYRHVFDVHRFTVDPFQFGADNDEGIQTGAFWFYRRFGFEPIDLKLKALANDEWRRIEMDRNYRSPMRVLRRLARCRIALDLVDQTKARCAAPDLTALGARMTQILGSVRYGDHRVAERNAFNRVLRSAEISRASLRQQHSDPQIRIAEQISPLTLAATELRTWPLQARRDLVKLLVSKGSERELSYVKYSQKHQHWRCLLESIVHDGRAGSGRLS